MALRREIIGADTVEAGMQSLSADIDQNLVAEWIVNFIQSDAM